MLSCLALCSSHSGKERAGVYVLLMHLFILHALLFFLFLFLLLWGVGCGLWLWHSLDFSINFFVCAEPSFWYFNVNPNTVCLYRQWRTTMFYSATNHWAEEHYTIWHRWPFLIVWWCQHDAISVHNVLMSEKSSLEKMCKNMCHSLKNICGVIHVNY